VTDYHFTRKFIRALSSVFPATLTDLLCNANTYNRWSPHIARDQHSSSRLLFLQPIWWLVQWLLYAIVTANSVQQILSCFQTLGWRGYTAAHFFFFDLGTAPWGQVFPEWEVKCVNYHVYISCPWTRRLSRDAPADVGFLCDKDFVFRDTMKRALRCRIW
jgi:hypothetical protein